MKKAVLIVLLVLFSFSQVSADNGKATVEDVYELVLKAYEVLTTLGDEGLAAFNDPKGEFVYKDTYVYVMECPNRMAAHPFAMEQLKDVDLFKYPHTTPICEAGQNPNGGWVEYQWPKPGQTEPSRKVGFSIAVPDTQYVVCGGIFNDDMSVEKLNKDLK